MEPSLVPGRLLVCRALGTRPRRGSIVVFPHPRHRATWLVKRIVGLPGEEVEIDFGRVLVNGDPGIDLWDPGDNTFPEGKWNVGEREVLVLSDNRPGTVDDGRSFGPVEIADMLKVIWPLVKRKRLRPR